jgi:hypothetical protein
LFSGFGFLTFETEDSVDMVVKEHFIQINGKQVRLTGTFTCLDTVPLLNNFKFMLCSNFSHFDGGFVAVSFNARDDKNIDSVSSEKDAFSFCCIL